MAGAQTPIRIDNDLAESARDVAPQLSRSVAQQISHWARLGRELERSPDLSVKDIQRVLAGQAGFDDLPPREQAVVRAEWLERMNALRSDLRLDEAFRAGKHQYAELDANGAVVIRKPRGSKGKAQAR